MRWVRTVGIPERESRSHGVAGSHDRVPLGGRGINTNSDSSSLATTDKTLEEGAVGRLVLPVLSSLNVEPEHADGGSSGAKGGNCALNLSLRISALLAREAKHAKTGY